jgi:hypothetical protein
VRCACRVRVACVCFTFYFFTEESEIGNREIAENGELESTEIRDCTYDTV